MAKTVLSFRKNVQMWIKDQNWRPAFGPMREHIQASFSVHKLIPKTNQMTTLYTNLLYITVTMIYYIRQE